MSPRLALALAALAVIGAKPAPPAAPSKVPELAGRSPGKPQRCLGVPGITTFSTAQSDPHLLIYTDGKTVWANRLSESCDFGPGETIVPDDAASYYCNGDFVRQGNLVELNPVRRRCPLGNFVPYRAPK